MICLEIIKSYLQRETLKGFAVAKQISASLNTSVVIRGNMNVFRPRVRREYGGRGERDAEVKPLGGSQPPAAASGVPVTSLALKSVRRKQTESLALAPRCLFFGILCLFLCFSCRHNSQNKKWRRSCFNGRLDSWSLIRILQTHGTVPQAIWLLAFFIHTIR